MTRPDPLRLTETYSFALAPVVGPFLEALGNLAHSLATASDNLHMERVALESPEDE
jgi:hypothetical protein